MCMYTASITRALESMSPTLHVMHACTAVEIMLTISTRPVASMSRGKLSQVDGCATDRTNYFIYPLNVHVCG